LKPINQSSQWVDPAGKGGKGGHLVPLEILKSPFGMKMSMKK